MHVIWNAHHDNSTTVLQNRELLAQQHNIIYLTLPNFTLFSSITNIIHFPTDINEITGDQQYEFDIPDPLCGEIFSASCK
jgi:hypothetical protein